MRYRLSSFCIASCRSFSRKSPRENVRFCEQLGAEAISRVADASSFISPLQAAAARRTPGGIQRDYDAS